VLNRNRLNDVIKIQKQAKKHLINRKIKKVMIEINNRVLLRRKKREEELRLLKEEQTRKEKEERERQRQQEQEKQGIKGILGRSSRLTMNDTIPVPKNRGQSFVSIDSDNEFDRENNSHIHKTVRDSVSEGMGK